MTTEQLNRGRELLDEIWKVEHDIKAMSAMKSIYITGSSGNDSMGHGIKLNEETEDSIVATEFVSQYRKYLNNKLQKLKDQFSNM